MPWLECPCCQKRLRHLYAHTAELAASHPHLTPHHGWACIACHDARPVNRHRVSHQRRMEAQQQRLAEQLGPDPLSIPRGTGDQPVRRARHIAKQRRYAAVLSRLNGEATKKLVTP